MTIDITPMARMGGEVSGLDLTRPLTTEDGNSLRNALEKYALLVFHDQPVSDEQQKAITNLFGPAQVTYSAINGRFKRRIARPDFSDIANLDENGDILKDPMMSVESSIYPTKFGIAILHSSSFRRPSHSCPRVRYRPKAETRNGLICGQLMMTCRRA
jgi:alpha-ketoglutarate-dependent 2,4-dichlorophenoxyacetate dioxygenase